MRKCISCGADMTECNAVSEIRIKRTDVYQKPEVALKAAMCPKCGYVELYTDELDRVDFNKKIDSFAK